MNNKNYTILALVCIVAIISLSTIYAFTYTETNSTPIDSVTINELTNDQRAMSMTENAINLYKETGIDNAFNEITFGDDHLIDEFYVFVINENDATIVAHGGDPIRVGATLVNQDSNPVRDIIMSEATPAGKWVKYNWNNPATENSEPKKSFIKTYDGYIFGSGYYLSTEKDVDKNSEN